MSELSREVEQKFRETSRRSAILSLIGAGVVIVGLLFATYGAIVESRKAEDKALLAMKRAELVAEQTRLAEEERREAERLREQLRLQAEVERLVWDGAELAGRGRITDAIRSYDLAIELNPNSAKAHQLRGYAHLRRAQIKPGAHPTDVADAVASLGKGVSLDPEHVWGHYNLALAYWEAGRKKDAVASVRRVLEIDPSFRSVISQDQQFVPFRESKEFLALTGTN